MDHERPVVREGSDLRDSNRLARQARRKMDNLAEVCTGGGTNTRNNLSPARPLGHELPNDPFYRLRADPRATCNEHLQDINGPQPRFQRLNMIATHTHAFFPPPRAPTAQPKPIEHPQRRESKTATT